MRFGSLLSFLLHFCHSRRVVVDWRERFPRKYYSPIPMVAGRSLLGERNWSSGAVHWLFSIIGNLSFSKISNWWRSNTMLIMRKWAAKWCTNLTIRISTPTTPVQVPRPQRPLSRKTWPWTAVEAKNPRLPPPASICGARPRVLIRQRPLTAPNR